MPTAPIPEVEPSQHNNYDNTHNTQVNTTHPQELPPVNPLPESTRPRKDGPGGN